MSKHYQFWRVEVQRNDSTMTYWGESECLRDVIIHIEEEFNVHHEQTTPYSDCYFVTFNEQTTAKLYPLKKGTR